VRCQGGAEGVEVPERGMGGEVQKMEAKLKL